MVRRTAVPVSLFLLLLLSLHAELLRADVPVSLRGSPDSMIRQNRIALEGEYVFMRTPAEIRAAVEAGELVELQGNEDYELAYRNFPYARPELRTFVERLAAQYRAGCGEKLYVTSLTRPLSRQPVNAHPLSVHPAGLAVDLRISQNGACQRWIEEALLEKEAQGLLDITREHRPPHYHVALFPESYLAFVEEQTRPAGWEPTFAGSDELGGLVLELELPAGAHGLSPVGVAEEREEEGRRWTSALVRVITFPARLIGRLLG